MPSQAELAFRQFKQRKESSAKQGKQSVVERYGDGGAQAAPEDLKALAQTEAYVEYDAAGERAGLLRLVLIPGWLSGVGGAIARRRQCCTAWDTPPRAVTGTGIS